MGRGHLRLRWGYFLRRNAGWEMKSEVDSAHWSQARSAVAA